MSKMEIAYQQILKLERPNDEFWQPNWRRQLPTPEISFGRIVPMHHFGNKTLARDPADRH
ncbi:hypothetical protein [Rhizobium sp. CG5]|uniref:hypothetical protein n=1 Tax=Rhizobium sp. CG5 TaxID=2726076 RepID=UPI002033962B|nr:hypothetical protein [Rhizobium sp. CG5]